MDTSKKRTKVMTVDEYMIGVGVDMLHAGGMKRTKDLAKNCGVSGIGSVLDIGCGYGRTASYLTRNFGCNVFGIDVSKAMICGARQMTKKEHTSLVHLQIGSAENIPFKDECFNIVISEGTTVLVNKERALQEYVRVAKRGGHVGLNELSWAKKPPKEVMERALNDLQGVAPLERDQWIELLLNSGLKDVQSRTYRYTSTSWDTIESIGFSNLVKVGYRYLTRSEIRKWINRQEAFFRITPTTGAMDCTGVRSHRGLPAR